MAKNDANVMADVLWKAYYREPDPAKRHCYKLRYDFWADIRDREMHGEGYCEDLKD